MSVYINIKNLNVEFEQGFTCKDITWSLTTGEHWLICGGNGSGKSAFAAILTGSGEILEGTVKGIPKRIGVVSFANQAELIEAERRKDDADIMDVIAEGTPVSEIIDQVCTDKSLAQSLIKKFSLEKLTDRAFRKLSTGETRKVMLIRALACKPELLILDEPFEGLDVDSLAALQTHLNTIAADIPIVLVLNRFDQCPDFITNGAYLEQGTITQNISRSDAQAWQQLEELLHLKTTGSLTAISRLKRLCNSLR